MKSIVFTKKKFLEQPKLRQEKYLAKILKLFFETKDPSWIKNYCEYASWLNYPALSSDGSIKSIFDRYHQHLNQAGIPSKESHFFLEKNDKDHASPLFGANIYLENIRSAHNIGSILRSTEALGLGPVFFSPKMPFIDHRRVKQTAMGCEDWLDCRVIDSLDLLPKPLIVFETTKLASSIYEFQFPDCFTMAFGNEEYGCSQELLQRADFFLKIPLRGRKNSLNVANAFSIAAAAFCRQKAFDE